MLGISRTKIEILFYQSYIKFDKLMTACELASVLYFFQKRKIEKDTNFQL